MASQQDYYINVIKNNVDEKLSNVTFESQYTHMWRIFMSKF